MKMFYYCSAGNSDNKPQHNISNRNLPAKNTGQQNEWSKINHRWRNQKTKGNPKRKSCSCKSHKKRNWRTRTKGCHRSQKRSNYPGRKSLAMRKYFFTSFRRKIWLNIWNQKYQHKKKNCDFNYIIKEKVKASTKAAFDIKSGSRKYFSNQCIEPLHSKNLVLNKTSHNR